MTTDITKTQSFEDRMKDRIKDSIGDLISDEDLSKLVTRGIEEAFFTEKVINTGSWNNQKQVIPPLIHQIVVDCLKDQIKDIASRYLDEHREEVDKVVKSVIDGGVMTAFHNALESKLNTTFFSFGEQIKTQLNLR